MTRSPRAVFGMTAYNRPDALARTIESLLSQTVTDFAIVIVDDRPSPDVRAIVDAYAALDTRIVYEPNHERLGMIANWRHAFDRGRARFPGTEFFAWVSDHDVWHPRWLEVLIGALEAHPRAVLAYPQVLRLYARGRLRITNLFDTVGVASRRVRLRGAATSMTAGNGIYGLFRATALAQVGVFRPVLLPDRQVLVELALLGEFVHVPEILWYREVAGAFSFTRQRQMFFQGRAPLHTYLPATVQHFGVLLWDFAVRGRGRPEFGRVLGAWYALCQLWYSTKRACLKNDAPWRVWLGRTPVGRWLGTRGVKMGERTRTGTLTVPGALE
jgi:glycosyltransferase involved in cell wall biosynthesis